MIDKRFFHYDTYAAYKAGRAQIPDEAIAFVAETRTVAQRGREYRAVGEVALDGLDALRGSTPATAGDIAGLRLVVDESGGTRRVAGLLLVYNDAMGHATHQVLLGNNILAGGGVSGSHMDTGLTVCWRSWGYVTSGGLTAGRWTDWAEADLHLLRGLEQTGYLSARLDALGTALAQAQDGIGALEERHGQAVRQCTLSGGNLYMSILSGTDPTARELFFRPATAATGGGSWFDIYLNAGWMSEVFADMAAGEARTVVVRVLTGRDVSRKAGYYVQAASGTVLTPTAMGDGTWRAYASDAKAYVWIDANAAGGQEADRVDVAAMMRFEVTFWHVSSSTRYVTVMTLPTAAPSRQ